MLVHHYCDIDMLLVKQANCAEAAKLYILYTVFLPVIVLKLRSWHRCFVWSYDKTNVT